MKKILFFFRSTCKTLASSRVLPDEDLIGALVDVEAAGGQKKKSVEISFYLHLVESEVN